jgi:hypothetical protein
MAAIGIRLLLNAYKCQKSPSHAYGDFNFKPSANKLIRYSWKMASNYGLTNAVHSVKRCLFFFCEGMQVGQGNIVTLLRQLRNVATTGNCE